MSSLPIFRLVKFEVIQVLSDETEQKLYESPQIPDQSSVELTDCAQLPEGIRSYLKVYFSIKDNAVKGLTCQRKVYKGPICVNTENALMGDFEPIEDVQDFKFAIMDTPSGMFVRGGFTTQLSFINNEKQVLMKIKYPFQIVKSK